MPRKRGLYGTSPPSVQHRYAMREREHFVPDFDQMLGHGNGYDVEDPSVSEKNVKALVEQMFDYEQLQHHDATRSWVAFWKYVHKQEEFWWHYFTGKSVRSSSTLRGSHHGDVITEWCFTDGCEREDERDSK